MESRSAIIASGNIAGFEYYNGVKVFDQLKIGSALRLLPEPSNHYDENAIRLYFQDEHIGYIPSRMNCKIAQLMFFGHGDIFAAEVTRVAPDLEPANQVSFRICIKDRREQIT